MIDPSGDAPADASLLTRYLAGVCTPAERDRVAAWLAADPLHRAEFDALRTVWDGAARPVVAWDTGSLWARLESGMQALDRPAVASAPSRDAASHSGALKRPIAFRRSRPRGAGGGVSRGWALRLALAGGAVVLGGIVLWAAQQVVELRTPLQRLRQFQTAAASRATVVLRDGTRLVLGPATRLRIPTDFGRTTRTVELSGEGFFAVTHDARHPFRVRTGNVVTTDVGTVFDVRAYAGDGAVRIVVAEGQVRVGTRGGRAASERPLQAGDVARVTDTNIVVDRTPHIAAFTAWVQGGLAFEDTPLREVVRDVERAFGVTVAVADSGLLEKQVTVSLANQPLDVVLDAITRVVGARYERSQQGIIIRHGAAGAGRHDMSPPLPMTTARVENNR